MSLPDSTVTRWQRAGYLCPACGSLMYEARLLKGYPKTGREVKRLTCALHGPRGQFRHIATDRPAKTGNEAQT